MAFTAAVTVLVSASAYAQDNTAGSAQPLIFHTVGTRQNTGAAEALLAKVRQQGTLRVRVGLRSHTARERGLNVSESADIELTQDLVASRVLGFGRKNTAKKFKILPVMSMIVSPDELRRLATDSDVEWVREVVTFRPTLEYTRHLVGADAVFSGAAKTAMDGSGYAVAVIDTGVDDTHPMLAGKIITAAAACFSGNFSGGQNESMCPGSGSTEFGPTAGRPCPLGDCWHGTHVASIAAGAGAVNGIARGAQIIPIMAAFNNHHMVSLADDDLYQALLYVYSLRNTYKIAAVNLSVQGALFKSACDTTFPEYAAIFDLLRQAGIAPVVSSGNMWGDNQLASPACVSNAVSVGATTKSDDVADYTNISANLTLLAPGSDIHAAIPGGGYKYASGTSMAAPHVAGAFAVLKEANSNASVDDITSALSCSGKPLFRQKSAAAKPRIDLVGAEDALIGSTRRRWKFESTDDSADWAALRGDWSIAGKAYLGQASDTAFVASMFSSCNKNFVVRTLMKIAEPTRGSTSTSQAGVILGATVNYVKNTISGYWLNYTDAPNGAASVLRLDGVGLDGLTSGSVNEVCSVQNPVIYAGRRNEVIADVSDTGFTFYLNGKAICQVPRTLSSQKIVLAGKFDAASPDKSLFVNVASVMPKKAAVASTKLMDGPSISQLAHTKRTVISVVRRTSEAQEEVQASVETR